MINALTPSISELFIKQHLGESHDDISLFRKNRVLDAKVLKVISSSRAEMLIAGKKMLADTTVSLKAGQILQLKVTDQNKLQILQPFQNVEKTVHSLLPLVSSFSKQGGLFDGLQKFADAFFKQPEKSFSQSNVDSFLEAKDTLQKQGTLNRRHSNSGALTYESLKSEKGFGRMELNTIKKLFLSLALKSEKTDPQFLPKLLEKSGLMWETKLNNFVKNEPFSAKSVNLGSPDEVRKMVQEDLKGAVLNLLDASDGEPGETLESLKGFTDNIEKFQLLNTHLSESGKYLIPFPVFINDMFRFGQLFIDLGSNGKAKNDEEQGILKVSLLLNMTRLGALRADFLFLKQNITGAFYVSDEDISIFIKNMIPELSQRLKTHDFLVGKIDCRVVASETLSEAALIEDILKDEQKGLSLIA